MKDKDFFDLTTQYIYDIFSHEKYLKTNDININKICGNLCITSNQPTQSAYLQVILKTEKCRKYNFVIEYNIGSTLCPFVECIDNGESLLTHIDDLKPDCIDCEAYYDSNCICNTVKKIKILFTAKSKYTSVGILFKSSKAIIEKFNINKCKIVCEESSSSSQTSVQSYCQKYPLQPFPKCTTHGTKCPVDDHLKYGNPDVCNRHGISCIKD